MNELQVAISGAQDELLDWTSELVYQLHGLKLARQIVDDQQVRNVRQRAEFVTAGVEGKNAEERQAHLTRLMDDIDLELQQAQRELDTRKYQYDTAVLRHQAARYALKAAIAISEARDV